MAGITISRSRNRNQDRPGSKLGRRSSRLIERLSGRDSCTDYTVRLTHEEYERIVADGVMNRLLSDVPLIRCWSDVDLLAISWLREIGHSACFVVPRMHPSTESALNTAPYINTSAPRVIHGHVENDRLMNPNMILFRAIGPTVADMAEPITGLIQIRLDANIIRWD